LGLDDLHGFLHGKKGDGHVAWGYYHTGCRVFRQPVTSHVDINVRSAEFVPTALVPRMILVQSLLTETDLAADFTASFAARRLAEKFFYWFPLSVRAWLALCSDGAYRNYVRSRSLIARSAGDVIGAIPSGVVEVLSLGSGQGDKDLLVLQAMARRGDLRASYVPVDTSQSLLELACRGAFDAGFATRGIKADFTRPDHLAALAAPAATPPRLVLLVGNTLGAFDPLAEARELHDLLRPQDLLLVDGEIYDARRTVAGYDNPLNRRFAWAPLEAVGIGAADGDLVFEDVIDERRPGLHVVRKHFQAKREVAAKLGGEEQLVRAGERLAMNHSYKYDVDAFPRILTEVGLTIRWRGQSEDQRFQMVLAERS